MMLELFMMVEFVEGWMYVFVSGGLFGDGCEVVVGSFVV